MRASEGFEEWVRGHVKDKLAEAADAHLEIYGGDVGKVYGRELAEALCEDEEANGCAIDHSGEAVRFIWEYSDEGAAALEWVNGEGLVEWGLNPLREPCYFTYWLLLWGVRKLLEKCPWCIRHEEEKGRLDARAAAEIAAYAEDEHIEFEL